VGSKKGVGRERESCRARQTLKVSKKSSRCRLSRGKVRDGDLLGKGRKETKLKGQRSTLNFCADTVAKAFNWKNKKVKGKSRADEEKRRTPSCV